MTKFYNIENRRYIGNKYKLVNWIFDIICRQTVHFNTFCDLFAGTGSVANKAFTLYNKVILNDFLISNNVIYNAFYSFGDWDKIKLQQIIDKYNNMADNQISDNWFSDNYGDKYFEYSAAKKIGFIRQDIEDNKNLLNNKEYCILLSSLIYSADKIANTVGHFDAYIKKNVRKDKFVLNLINAQSYSNVEIYTEDANLLVKDIESDIIYIDPPYNSRQYSRFYHVYETLVKWNHPKLYGVARKPVADNMSEYCRSNAKNIFTDLIKNIKSKYIAVSYNNTYTSKSHSSENKIKLDDIYNILNEVGKTEYFIHDYKAFNTGKTDLSNHKEYLFLTKL